jgi:hypothetical protein
MVNSILPSAKKQKQQQLVQHNCTYCKGQKVKKGQRLNLIERPALRDVVVTPSWVM